MMPHFDGFFISYRHGLSNGYARFYADPNAMYGSLSQSDKDTLVDARYEILSVNTEDYLNSVILSQNKDLMEAGIPAVGQVFAAKYNPASGFMLSGQGISWNLERIYDVLAIDKCRDMVPESAIRNARAIQLETIGSIRSHVMDSIKDGEYRKEVLRYLDRCRASVEETGSFSKDKDRYVYVYIPDGRKGYSPIRMYAKVICRDGDFLRLVFLSQDSPMNGKVCIIDRSSDICRIETIIRRNDLASARALYESVNMADGDVLSLRCLMECMMAGQRIVC